MSSRHESPYGAHSVDSKKRVSATVVILAIVVVVCLCGAIAGGIYLLQAQSQINAASQNEQPLPATPQSESSDGLADNPIDFSDLQTSNSDVCGWIYIPGTKVNYPVVQSSANDNFYLKHDSDGKKNVLGAIYTERVNARDFTDHVTIVYGHNGVDDQMFGPLHSFEDPEFFDENSTFYIYTPGHIYTYTIVSAFTTDDIHLMYKYQYFYSKEQIKLFFKEITNPDGIVSNARKDIKLKASDNVVVLSTCNTGALSENARFLVCGVMTEDQQTN